MTQEFESIHKEFCVAVLDYIDNQNARYWFNKHHGLCANFYIFLHTLNIARKLIAALEDEFDALLWREYGTPVFPFNTSYMNYIDEARDYTLYSNPKRMAHLRKYGAE